MDMRRDHLIHRKRSPFPYEGKDLTPLKVSEYSIVECLPIYVIWSLVSWLRLPGAAIDY